MDALQARKIPVYKFVDFFENRNIPSMPIFFLLVALVLVGIGFAAYSFLVPQNVSLTVSVSTQGVELQGADVIVSGGEFFETASTDMQGIAVLSVPIGMELDVEAKKDGYITREFEGLVFEEDSEKAISLDRQLEFSSKTISFLNENDELITDDIALQFSCSNSDAYYSATDTAEYGSVELGEIPENCGALVLEFAQGYTTEQPEVDLTEASPTVYLQRERASGTATVYYNVVDAETEEGVFGLQVSLYNANGITQELQESPQSGMGMFENVPAGAYYLSVAGMGDYQDAESETLAVESHDSIEFPTIYLQKSVAGEIKVQVMDSISNTAVVNAEVKLISGEIVKQTRYSDAEGKVVFPVAVNTAYDIEVDHPDHLLVEDSGLTPQEEFHTYYLEQLTADNAQSIIAKVGDQYGKPVSGAKIKLRQSDATPIGDELVTGSDGRAEFLNTPPGDYYLYAVKEGFAEAYSSTFTLRAKQILEEEIVLNIGSGTIIVSVLDAERNPLHGATVKAIDFYTKGLLEEKTTDVEGGTSFSIRADKKVFFTIEHSAFLPYTTAPSMPSTSEDKVITVGLEEDVAKLMVKLGELQLLEDTVFSSLDAGKIYKGTAHLLVPKDTVYDRVGVHLRTGKAVEGKSNLMEEDIAVFKSITSSASKTKRGTSYTPLLGMSEDLAHLTGGNAKWVDIEWDLTSGKYPQAGLFEIEFELEVKGEAEQGDVLDLFYRGFAVKGSTYERDPDDAILASNETVGSKESLYAMTKAKTYSIGPSNLCHEGFCKQLVVEDLSTELETSIVNFYSTKITGEYVLEFRITQQEEKTHSDAEFTIKNDSSGLLLKNYRITTPAGRQITGNAEGFELTEEIGTLGKGSVLTGTVRFETQKEGINSLVLGIVAEKKQVFEHAIEVDVLPARELFLSILPKVIVPYIDNRLLIRVADEDDMGIGNAIVNVYLNEELVKSGTTTVDGVMPFELEAPALGDVLKIVGKKNDFKSVETEIVVTEDLLEVMPPEIDLDLVPSTGAEQERELIFSNLTVLDLKIERIALSAEFEDFVELNGAESVSDLVLDLNKDVNATVRFELTEEGKLIEEPKTIEGTLAVYLTNEEIGRNWLMKIPARIRIKLGGEVDNRDCLVLLDKEGKALEPWGILASDDPVTKEAVLKNDCRVDNIAIPLKNLEVGIDWKGETELGEFQIYSTAFDTGTVENAIVREFLDPEEEINISLKFVPNKEVKSGERAPRIVFQAKHLTETGIEELKTEYGVRIILTRLEECVKLVPIGVQGEAGEMDENAEGAQIIDLTLYTCGTNTGWGQYPQHFGNGMSYNQGFGGQFNGYMGPMSGNMGLSGMGMNPMLGGQFGLHSGTGMPGQFTGNPRLGSYNYNQQFAGGAFNNPMFGSAHRYYPNQGFNNPWMTGHRGNNLNWLCEQTKDQGKFKIVNSCNAAIEIKIDQSSQLRVKKNKVKVDGKGEIEISLMPGIFSGRYPVVVNSRLEGTENNFTEVGKVYATIIRPGEILNRCKPILSPTTFQVRAIGWLETEGKIYNHCANMGYHLLPFGAQDISCYTPQQTPTMMPGMGLSAIGSCPMISYMRSSPPTLTVQGNGQAIETIHFGLRFNPSVIEQWPGFVEGTMAERTGNLRLSLGRFTHSIVTPGKAVVKYSTPFSPQALAEVYDIILMDPYQAFGGLDVLMKHGNPDLEPHQCIRNANEYFDLVARSEGKVGGKNKEYRYPTEKWIGDSYFSEERGTVAEFHWGNKMQWLMKIPRTRNDVIGHYQVGVTGTQAQVQQGGQFGLHPQQQMMMNQQMINNRAVVRGDFCGEADGITSVCEPITDPTSNVTIRFELTDGGHNISMIVDRSRMNKACAKVEGKCKINVTRTQHHEGTVPVSLKVKAWVLNEGVEVPAKGKENECLARTQAPPTGAGTGGPGAVVVGGLSGKQLAKLPPGTKLEDLRTLKTEKQIEAIGSTELFCSGEEGAVTGQGAYEKYGFDKYLLTWKYEDVAEDVCESKFCDATQFTIAMTKKANTVNDKLEELSASHIEDICGMYGVNCADMKRLADAYPLTKDTVQITENLTDVKKLYFKGEDGELLEAEPSVDCQSGTITGMIENIITNREYSELEKAIQDIEKELKRCYPGLDASNVVGVITRNEDIDTNMVPFTKGILDGMGTDKYVLTLPEYLAIHAGLMEKSAHASGGCLTTIHAQAINDGDIASAIGDCWWASLYSSGASIEETYTSSGFAQGKCSFDMSTKRAYHSDGLAHYHWSARLEDSLNVLRVHKCTAQVGSIDLSGNDHQWTRFLEDLVNNVKWKVVYNHVTTDSEEVQERIRMNAKDKVTGLEVESEKVYLIGDYFSTDFKEDFQKSYPRVDDSIPDWKFTQFNVNKARGTLTSNKSVPESEKYAAGWNSGTYLARYNPTIKIENDRILLGGNAQVDYGLWKTLDVMDEENETFYNENIFLKVPFDGTVGLEDDMTRRDYGSDIKKRGDTWAKAEDAKCWEGRVKFAEENNTDPYCVKYDWGWFSSIPIIGVLTGINCNEIEELRLDGAPCKGAFGTCQAGRCIKSDGAAVEKVAETELASLFNYYSANKTGMALTDELEKAVSGSLEIEASTETRFESLQNGIIVSLSLNNTWPEASLYYNPGLPTGVKVDSSKNTEVYYRLTEAADDKKWELGDYCGGVPCNLMKWLGRDGETTIKDSLNEFEESSVCEHWEDSELLAKLETGDQAILNTVAITPLTKAAGKMQLFCSNNATQITTKSWSKDILKRTEKVTGASGGTVKLVPDEETKVLGLKEYIEKIRTGEICVKHTGTDLDGAEQIDGTHLIWNAEHFLIDKPTRTIYEERTESTASTGSTTTERSSTTESTGARTTTTTRTAETATTTEKRPPTEKEKLAVLLNSNEFNPTFLPESEVKSLQVEDPIVNASLKRKVCAEVEGVPGKIVAGDTPGHKICLKVAGLAINPCPGNSTIYGLYGDAGIANAKIKKIEKIGKKYKITTDSVLNPEVNESELKGLQWTGC